MRRTLCAHWRIRSRQAVFRQMLGKIAFWLLSTETSTEFTDDVLASG